MAERARAATVLELPSAEDVQAYRRRGWYVSAPFLSHALLDEMRLVLHAHQRREASNRLPAEIGHADWRPTDGAGVRNSEFLSAQEPAIRALSLSEAIGAIAARLAGTDAIRLFDDQAVVKQPDDGDAVVGWHTDHSYWSTCTSTEMLTAWIPFEDATVENGTLMVVEGSHRWPEVDHLRGFKEPDLGRLSQVLGREVEALPLELRKGQVSFHHMRLVHGSAPNRSPRPRVAVAVHLQDHANSYRPYLAADGKPVVLPHDRLCRRDATGNPDYRDPDVFPVLWGRCEAGHDG